MEPAPEGAHVRCFELYKDGVDYDELVRLVFEYDKVTCWW